MRPFFIGICGLPMLFVPGAARAADEPASALTEMKETSRTVRGLLRTARKRGTREQIACVDEALSRVDVALRSAREQAAAAHDADAHGDSEGAGRARLRVFELRDAARVASRAATKCAPNPNPNPNPPAPPPPKVVLGTTVRVVVDPSIPRVEL